MSDRIVSLGFSERSGDTLDQHWLLVHVLYELSSYTISTGVGSDFDRLSELASVQPQSDCVNRRRNRDRSRPCGAACGEGIFGLEQGPRC